MIIAVSGGQSLEATGPQGACSTGWEETHPEKASAGERMSPDHRTYVRFSHPPKGGADRVSAAAQTLQRIRERLELAAIAAGCSRPEQTAAALLGEGGWR